jgi:YqjK-like protein
VSARTEQLARRRRELQVLCEMQRREVGRTGLAVETQLATVDRGITIVRRLFSSPLLIVAGVAIIGVAGPGRVLRWTSHALLLRTALKRVSQA